MSFNNNESLTVDGTAISNAGAINLNSTGNGTGLVIGGSNVTLSGGGNVTFATDNANNIIHGTSSINTFTNQGTIQGSGGTITSLILDNQGTINATAGGPGVAVSPGTDPDINTGTLEATGGGTLVLDAALTNTGGTDHGGIRLHSLSEPSGHHGRHAGRCGDFRNSVLLDGHQHA